MNDITEIKKLAETQPEEGKQILRVVSPRRAEYALAILSFCESSFLPVIMEPFLIGAIALHRDRWFRYVAITAIASVAGACVAYTVGAVFWNAFGEALITWLGVQAAFAKVQALVGHGPVLFTLIGGFMPVPYKITALVAGLFHINIVAFVLTSLFVRMVRFSIVGYLAHLGRTHGARILAHLTWRRTFALGLAIGVVAAAIVLLR